MENLQTQNTQIFAGTKDQFIDALSTDAGEKPVEFLFDFVKNKMRMTSYYQPIILLALLDRVGCSDDDAIAEFILEHETKAKGKNADKLKTDQSKGLKALRKLINNYPKKVLSSHGVLEITEQGLWILPFEIYSSDFDKIEKLLEQKLFEHLNK